MKKLEKAPLWYDDDLQREADKIRNEIDVNEYIIPINNDYLYWDKVKYKKVHDTIKPEVLWSLVKVNRILTSRKLAFGKYQFSYNVTDFIQKALHEFDLNIGGSLSANSIIPTDEKKRYLLSSIMEEAIASSQIEGAVTTRKRAKEILRKNIKPKTKDEQMIVNNFITIKNIVEIKNQNIDVGKFLEIHKLISSETLDDSNDEGKYRDNNDINIVDSADNEIVHIPPPFDEIPSLMNDLFIFFNTDTDQFIHPIIKGCIIHFMIGYIHPFVDGSGRTARALFYWYLLKNGYWLTEYLSISRLIVKSKTQYAKAYLYTETDNNDLTYFIRYKIKTMQSAYEELKIYIERKINEKKHFISFQKIPGVNERQAEIIKWIFEEPDLLFNVREIENRFNISNQTARTDLTKLQAQGFLEIIDINNKTKGFSKSADFDNILSKLLPDI